MKRSSKKKMRKQEEVPDLDDDFNADYSPQRLPD